MRALLLALCLLLVAGHAEAARKTPSTRLSSQAKPSGAHTATVSIPSGTTTALIAFAWGYGSAGNQAPTSVTLDGQTAVKKVSDETAGALQTAIYAVTGFTTGASKTLAWTNPVSYSALDIAIEYRDGTITYGATDSDDCNGCGSLTTLSLANSNGDEFLSYYATNTGTITGVGSGQTQLDDTTGDSENGFTTKTTTGSATTSSFTISGLAGYSAILLTTSSSSGAFDVSPGVASQTSTAYTITGSLSGSGTVNAVACYAGESAPSKAQVQAGKCSAGETAKATGSASPNSGNFDFSFTLTPSDSPAFPLYDIHVTDGTTLVSLTSQCLVAPSGKQFINCPAGLTSIASGGAVDLLNALISPTWAVGDVPVCDVYTHTVPGGTQQFAFHLSLSGYASYDQGTGARTYANCDAYDLSAHQYHTQNSANNDLDWWDQDQNVGCVASFNWVLKVGVGTNVNPNPGNLDFSSLCSHPLGDTLSAALKSGTWPTGITLSGTIASGTPTVENESGASITVTATSTLTGASRDLLFTAYPLVTLTLTSCLSPLKLTTDCVSSIRSQFHAGTSNGTGITVNTNYDYSNSVASGYVISQSPAAGSEVAPYAAVTVLGSLGSLLTKVVVPNCIGKTYLQCQTLVQASSVSATTSSTCAATDHVYSQSPAANRTALNSYVLTALCR